MFISATMFTQTMNKDDELFQVITRFPALCEKLCPVFCKPRISLVIHSDSLKVYSAFVECKDSIKIIKIADGKINMLCAYMILTANFINRC